MKTVLAVLLVLALAAGGFAIYKSITRLEAKVEEVDARADKTIAEKEAANQILLAENVVLREKDAAGEIEKAQIRRERDLARIERDKAINELKTAPPETVLAKTQGWLDTREIWLRSNAASQVEAVFSLAAFRLNAEALEDRSYLKFTLVPNMERDYQVQAGQLIAVRTERDNLVVIVGNKDIELAAKDDKITVRDDVITTLKKANLWRELRDFSFGYLVATIINLIFGK